MARVLESALRHRHRVVLLRLLAAIGLLAAVWTAGLIWFANSLPESVSEPRRQTDAIVVLTGGSGRLHRGFELLEAKLARKLFVSGVYRGVEVKELLGFFQGAPEELVCCVELGYEADDTRGNARETAQWMREQGFGSLRLVTASYHMPRSLIEFTQAMPQIEIVPHPTLSANFRQSDWWLWPGSSGLLATEYSKYLIALVRSGLPPNTL
ncbi:MAG: YdcF family protein [Kiloniellales bacterium]|nr:YdcF family protein [Kiloniellales bacterium]